MKVYIQTLEVIDRPTGKTIAHYEKEFTEDNKPAARIFQGNMQWTDTQGYKITLDNPLQIGPFTHEGICRVEKNRPEVKDNLCKTVAREIHNVLERHCAFLNEAGPHNEAAIRDMLGFWQQSRFTQTERYDVTVIGKIRQRTVKED